MIIKHENLSWDVLDYWRASGLDPCTIEPAPLLVAREAGGIRGFAAIGNKELEVPDYAVIEPLLADNLYITLALMDEMEKILRDAGYVGYLFFTDANSPEGFTEQVRRCGAFIELGDNGDAHWFERKLVTVPDVKQRQS